MLTHSSSRCATEILDSPTTALSHSGLPNIDRTGDDFENAKTIDFQASPVSPDFDLYVRQLFQMSLWSLDAYQEIADHAATGHVRNFADVLVRERHAECRALGRLSARPASRSSISREAASLRMNWLRAVQALEQGELASFVKAAAQAESVLELAYTNAMDLAPQRCTAELLGELRMNVTGAREWLEEAAHGPVRSNAESMCESHS